jgi:cell division protein FtsQ
MGQHKIVIGKSSDLKKKITKLKAFYKHGLEEIGWDKYKILNLKYENQVVCTKN